MPRAAKNIYYTAATHMSDEHKHEIKWLVMQLDHELRNFPYKMPSQIRHWKDYDALIEVVLGMDAKIKSPNKALEEANQAIEQRLAALSASYIKRENDHLTAEAAEKLEAILPEEAEKLEAILLETELTAAEYKSTKLNFEELLKFDFLARLPEPYEPGPATSQGDLFRSARRLFSGPLKASTEHVGIATRPYLTIHPVKN